MLIRSERMQAGTALYLFRLLHFGNSSNERQVNERLALSIFVNCYLKIIVVLKSSLILEHVFSLENTIYYKYF